MHDDLFVSFAHEILIGNEVLAEENDKLTPTYVINISTIQMEGNICLIHMYLKLFSAIFIDIYFSNRLTIND